VNAAQTIPLSAVRRRVPSSASTLTRPRAQAADGRRLTATLSEDVGGIRLVFDSINVLDRANYLTGMGRFGPYDALRLGPVTIAAGWLVELLGAPPPASVPPR